MRKNRFLILLILLLMLIFVCSGCVEEKTYNTHILLYGNNMETTLDLGSFAVAELSSVDKVQIVEVFIDDVEKFLNFLRNSDYYVGETILKDCYDFEGIFSENFNIGDKSIVFEKQGTYWVCRNVMNKYFYFICVPNVQIRSVDKDNTKIGVSFPQFIFAPDANPENSNTLYKVAYSYDELKNIIANKKCEDNLNRIYIDCLYINSNSNIYGEGITYFSFDSNDNTITFADEYEVSYDANQNLQS